MKNSKIILSGLSIFFTTLFVFVALLGTARIAGFCSALIDSSNNKNIRYKNEMKIKKNIQYIRNEHKHSTQLVYSTSDYIMNTFRIINIKNNEDSFTSSLIPFLNNVLSIMFLIFYLFETQLLFRRLKYTLMKCKWFSDTVYDPLKRIVYYMFTFFITKLSFEIYYCFINEDSIASGAIFPYSDYIDLFGKTMIIFVITLVYKVGMKIHKEQELTI